MTKKNILMLLVLGVFSIGLATFAEDDGTSDSDAAKRIKKEAREKAKDAREAAREKTKEARADAKDDVATAKEKIDSAKDKVKDKIDAAKDKGRGNAIDQRQENQDKRIQHGINKGYLTEDEAKSLIDEQKKISDMESSFKSDGKLTKDEHKQLHDELQSASASIWSEKHDTDGNQMPTYRFGKNVFAKDSLTSQLSNENLTGAEAKAITADFKKMMQLKHSLATGNLSDEARTAKQSEYDSLLNKYFEVR